MHASLLPKYRGASPINRAIIEGEIETGISTMYTDVGMDTGDVLLVSKVHIDEDMTAGVLHDKLSRLGADVLRDTLAKLEDGSIERRPQDESRSSFAGMMDKDTGRIDWALKARKIHNLVRGTDPGPGAYTWYKDIKLKIWKTKVIREEDSGEVFGKIISVSKDGIDVSTGSGVLRILELQAPSKKRMQVSQYILGNVMEEGEIFWQGN